MGFRLNRGGINYCSIEPSVRLFTDTANHSTLTFVGDSRSGERIRAKFIWVICIGPRRARVPSTLTDRCGTPARRIIPERIPPLRLKCALRKVIGTAPYQFVMHRNLQRALLVAVFALFAAVLVWGLTRSSNGKPTPPEVKLEKRPERIISLSPGVTEILFAVGAGPRVVANTIVDNYPPEAKALPKVGGFSPNTINIEAILALKPDVVFVAGAFQETVIAQAMSERGIPIIIVEPNSIDDVLKAIQLIGRLTETSEKAEAVIADIRNRREAVRKRVEAIPVEARPRTVYILNEEPLMAIGSGSFVAELLKESGAKNIFGDIQQQFPRVGDEDILSRGADIIIAQNHLDGGPSTSLAKRPGWEKLNAVKNGKVIAIDPDLLTRPGPRLIDGLEALEKAIAGR